MKKLYTSFLTLVLALVAMAANAMGGDAPAAGPVSISNISLTVAEGEQIDEDGDFKVTFNYTVKIADESVKAAGNMKISVFDADNNTVVDGESWTFSPSQNFKNLYISNLQGGKEYTIRIDEITIKDNSKIDWETVFEGEEILKITEGLPTLKFTPIAAAVKAVDVKDMKIVADKNAVIDEDGDYPLTFNYTGKINDESINVEDVIGLIKYEVYDENFVPVSTGNRDFSFTETSRSVYVSGLTAGKSYYLYVTNLVVYGKDGELLNMTDGLPKLTFKVKDPNAQQAITMSNMSFFVAEGEQIDEEGDFMITFNYTATINDPSAITFAFATVEYTITDQDGNKVCNSLADFNYEGTYRNFYVYNLEAGKTYTITATKIQIQDLSMEMLCELSKDLPSLTFTVGGSTDTGISNPAINPVQPAKIMENGKIIIVKNGKKFGVNGVEVK